LHLKVWSLSADFVVSIFLLIPSPPRARQNRIHFIRTIVKNTLNWSVLDIASQKKDKHEERW